MKVPIFNFSLPLSGQWDRFLVPLPDGSFIKLFNPTSDLRVPTSISHIYIPKDVSSGTLVRMASRKRRSTSFQLTKLHHART
jgi:hypothetical protein